MTEQPAPRSRTSVPTLRQSLTLESLQTIRVFEQCFERIDYYCYLSSVLVRLHGGRSARFRSEIGQVVEVITTCLEEVERYFETKEAELSRRLERKKRQTASLSLTLPLVYRHPRTLEAAVRTPKAYRFLTLLGRLDVICRLIDTAWFAGLMNDEEHLQQGTGATRQLTRLTARVGILAKGVARRVLEGEAAAVREDYQALLGTAIPLETEPENSAAELEGPLDAERLVEKLQTQLALEEPLPATASALTVEAGHENSQTELAGPLEAEPSGEQQPPPLALNKPLPAAETALLSEVSR